MLLVPDKLSWLEYIVVPRAKVKLLLPRISLSRASACPTARCVSYGRVPHDISQVRFCEPFVPSYYARYDDILIQSGRTCSTGETHASNRQLVRNLLSDSVLIGLHRGPVTIVPDRIPDNSIIPDRVKSIKVRS